MTKFLNLFAYVALYTYILLNSKYDLFNVLRYISLSSSLKDFEFRYIKQIWCGISIDGFYLKSLSFKDLLSLAEKHSVVVVKGPKGVGKSSALVGMLANYSLCEIPTILLTQDSLKCPSSTFSYLKKVAERFNLGKNAYHTAKTYLCVI